MRSQSGAFLSFSAMVIHPKKSAQANPGGNLLLPNRREVTTPDERATKNPPGFRWAGSGRSSRTTKTSAILGVFCTMSSGKLPDHANTAQALFNRVERGLLHAQLCRLSLPCRNATEPHCHLRVVSADGVAGD